ncbi:sigma-70 family RNA polymerase sigma factor [Patescibacteria group bacterium]|nr:sigma-70 family RNA polymerase sigma factor [Patescibacteria group bacterium]MBU1074477.1 sigma-70 family RNA polymerase sigma factor [Patescibacteria group bacterium]MBU1951947.1 sigma-70 family RNA polymerase sigma factor [Patescibacteria group bacterium]MBU2229280.1 sigma-70 family RNA polymerase sigma factor [Patescibacteria group bacterium]
MAVIRDCNLKSDEELVELTLSDQGWYLCLMQRYEAKLTRFIRRISGVNDQDLEDILQDVFIKVYRNLNNFDLDLKFSSWIYRICRNHVISHYRKVQSRPQSIGGEDGELILHMIKDDNDPHELIDETLSNEKIQKVLSQMDKKYQEVIVLKYLEDKDYQEISDILKKPVGTIGTLLSRAKKQFKQVVQKQGTEF